MAIEISQLQTADIDAVDSLMKQNSGTIGFLPRVVLEKHVNDQGVLGAKGENSELAGYLLYASNRDRIRIVQLCVADNFRGHGIARQLLETLRASATTQKVIRLHCRNDFPAHAMWPKLGFVPESEKPGRSREGYPLTRWRLAIAADDQLALFRANVSEDVLDVVIDAQVFFDFNEPASEKTLPSQALLSDLFVDSLNVWVTDELLTEINRSTDAIERNSARTRASQFFEVRHDPIATEGLAASLRKVLSSANDSQISDINHLAKAGASDVRIFVTRDQILLREAEQIGQVTGLQVLSPAELILRLKELSDTQAETPDRVAGLGLVWRNLSANELSEFPLRQSLQPSERLGQLRPKVEAALVDPSSQTQVLWSEKEPVALRVLNRGTPKTLTLSLGRTVSSERHALFGRFVVADVIYRAVQENFAMVKVDGTALPDDLLQGASDLGFTECNGAYIKFCFTNSLDKNQALARISTLSPESLVNYQGMGILEIERHCSPMISEADQNYYMIPIRPGYALNLFDRLQSGRDLFGGDQGVLLRWANVYYRSGRAPGLVQAPGRILWYVSGGSKEIVAVSRLDEVIVDTPKELFKRFKRYGTLEWTDLYAMSNRDISTNIMALRFSHTFPFRRRVPLSEIRRIFREDSLRGFIQGPRKIPQPTFSKLFQLGYPEE